MTLGRVYWSASVRWRYQYVRTRGGQEVVRTVRMKPDLARLQRRVVDVLVTDLAKFFDIIAHDVHPVVGAGRAWETPAT